VTASRKQLEGRVTLPDGKHTELSGLMAALSPQLMFHHVHTLMVPSTEEVSRQSPFGCTAMLQMTSLCAWNESTSSPSTSSQ
jgi:hypothetical protein